MASCSRAGQQAALQPGVLLSLHLTRLQGHGRLLCLLALDRVAHRPPEQLGLDTPLDEVVLGPGCHRRQSCLLLREAGEHDDSDLIGVGSNAGHRFQALGVRQVQIQ